LTGSHSGGLAGANGSWCVSGLIDFGDVTTGWGVS
jgi:hypothetical protein